ncbi:hypothetical protein V8F33_001046 [Rhypophila sp. PSN 637]
MKTTSFIFFISALIAGVSAIPAEDVLKARQTTCHTPSSCKTSWSGKCEDYCGNGATYKKFSHMSSDGCSGLSKKCCCKK